MTPSPPRVLFLAFGELGSTVYRSQVVSVVARMAERVPIRLVQFLSPRRFVDRRMDARFRKNLSEVDALLPEPALALWAVPGRLDPGWSAPFALRTLRSVISDAPLVAHCRGPWAAAIGLGLRQRLPNVKVAFDCRGARPAEIRMNGGPARLARQAATLERRAVRESDAVLCVTSALGDYLAEAYGPASGGFTVAPAGFDERRFRFDSRAREARRRALELGDRPLFVYSGGGDAWQGIALNAGLLRAILDAEPEAHVLGLSQDPAQVDRALADAGIPENRRLVRRVPFDDVPSYLCAADAAVVLREDSIVNRVASPVKFAEYQGCGLPTAVSERLGDASGYVRERRAGVVCGPDVGRAAADLLDLARLDRAEPGRRTERARAAAGRLSIGANLDTLEGLYRSLIGG